MRVKAASAAILLILATTYTAPAALAASSKAPEYARITAEGFQERLTASIEEEGGVKTEDGDTLRVELNEEAKVLFFTRPGHRAHPAIVEVQIVEAENGPSIDTSGWWAGDARAFESWFRLFQRRNERLSRQWQQD